LLDQAASQGAELAITPECVLHGYGPSSTRADRDRLGRIAEPLDGARLKRIRDLARKRRLVVVVGFAEKGEGGTVHNSAALISKSGEILDVYRKVHCRPFEDIHHDGGFTPGDRFVVHELKFGNRAFKIGIMICFDREITESVRCLRALGAEFVACPLATATFALERHKNRADNEMITRCRAAENELFIAVVNHAGRFNGGSFVVGPKGEALRQMGPEEGVCVLDVPLGSVAGDFHSKPRGWMGWAFRRPEVYRRYLP
jgi:predicted amidohydrolase